MNLFWVSIFYTIKEEKFIMKLKKIVSLALAGILAVSMLTACGDNTTDNGGASSGDTTPSSTFTSTVLDKTTAATQLKLSASSNTKLDQAVTYAARNNTYDTYRDVLTVVGASSDVVSDAAKFMDGAEPYTADPQKWNFSGVDKDQTYWTMYAVTSSKSDEWIANEVADVLDKAAATMHEVEGTKGQTWDYTVSVVKADCKANANNEKVGDTTLVGIAITVDYTAANY